MHKNIIINYVGGSGGEFLGSLLIRAAPYVGPISDYVINSHGRVITKLNDHFIKQFAPQPTHFYLRSWKSDWQSLTQLESPWFLLITDQSQTEFLKEKLQDQVIVISLSYTRDYWLFVADSFCRKILDLPDYLTTTIMGEQFLNKVANTPEEKKYFLDLGSQGKLGSWYMDHLISGRVFYPPKENLYQGDLTINLSDLLSVSGLSNFFQKNSPVLQVDIDYNQLNQLHQAWLDQQFLYKR